MATRKKERSPHQFDMTVLNDMDRFHLVQNVLDRVPQLGDEIAYVKQEMQDKLIRHKQYIRENGMDMPKIRNWEWEMDKK